MQLAPTDELVLVSGHRPIRAKKLRYYEDRRFTERVLPAPSLNEAGCRDLPAARADDWTGQVRGTDLRLAGDEDAHDRADTGGLEQARHPGRENDPVVTAEPEIADPLGLAEEECDPASARPPPDHCPPPGAPAPVRGVDAA